MHPTFAAALAFSYSTSGVTQFVHEPASPQAPAIREGDKSNRRIRGKSLGELDKNGPEKFQKTPPVIVTRGDQASSSMSQ